MANFSYEKIFNAIKLDDLVTFSQLIKDCKNLSFGRFPLLSLCYLYNAKNIIKKYHKTLGKIKEYQIVSESFEIYQKFKLYAGRCLRLYLDANSIISPLEMLAILKQDSLVKKYYNNYFKSIQTIKNLTIIYQAIYGQKIQISNTNIKLGRAKLNYQFKQNLKLGMWVSVSFVAFIIIFVTMFATMFGLGTSFSTAKIQTPSQFVSALKFNGNYIIDSDFSIDGNFVGINFSGTIDGKNHTIYVNGLPKYNLIATNNGTIKNLNIVYTDINEQIDKSVSLLAGTNNGVIDNVKITCNNLNLDCLKTQNSDIYISGFANQNNGYIKNCNIKLSSNISASGEGECFVSGFAGTNNGTISSCNFNTDSSVSTTEADLSGFTINNNEKGNISACKNYANLMQTSNKNMWSPNCSGFVQTNYGSVTNCYNYGQIAVNSKFAESSQAVVLAGGIGAINYGNISHCLNKGEIVVTSINKIVYCGGITARSEYWVKDNQMILPELEYNGCQSNINVKTETETAFAFVGGLTGYLYGNINNCYSIATFTNGNDQTKNFVGTALGSSYLQYDFFNSIICISATNNFVLEQGNVEYQLGSLISNNQIVSKGQDSPNKEIITLATIEQIIKQEVYWTDEN